MMPFPDALGNFSENGSFKLKSSPLYSDNIRRLEKSIKQLKEERTKTPQFHIYLNNVQLIPYKQKKTLRLTETVTGEENQESSLVALKKDLLSLLTHACEWELIELERLFFYPNCEDERTVTYDFYDTLLHSLIQNASLRKLSITPFSLIKHQASLVHFLSQHRELDALHLEVNGASKQDWLMLCQVVAVHPKLKFFNLGSSILDANAYSALANLLDENYRVEITLSEPTSDDEDLLNAYEPLKQRLSKPGLERFKEKYLSQDHLFQMASTIVESLRYLKSSPEQHQEPVQLEEQFRFLLRSKDATALPDQLKNYHDVLCFVYGKHAYLINEESPSLVQLHINSLVANKAQTVGYTLLEKAFEIQHRGIMGILLNAKANCLEFPKDEEEPFLVKVLQSQGDISNLVLDYLWEDSRLGKSALLQLPVASKDRTIGYILLEKSLKTQNCHALQDLLNAKVNLFEFPRDEKEPFLVKVFQSQGEIKELIVEYIRKDSRLIQLALECLRPEDYADLINVFKDFKKHLDDYNFSYKAAALIGQFETEEDKDKIKIKKDKIIKDQSEKIKQLEERIERERAEMNKKQSKAEVKQAEIEAKLEKSEAGNVEIKIENAEMKAERSKIKATLSRLLRQMPFSNAAGASRASDTHNQERLEVSKGFFAKP